MKGKYLNFFLWIFTIFVIKRRAIRAETERNLKPHNAQGPEQLMIYKYFIMINAWSAGSVPTVPIFPDTFLTPKPIIALLEQARIKPSSREKVYDDSQLPGRDYNPGDVQLQCGLLFLDLQSSVSWAPAPSVGLQQPPWEQNIKQIRPGKGCA